MNLKQIYFLFTLILLSCFICNAQDPQFTQFYASPTYLNPAFTGNTTQGRITSNYRKQWPSIKTAFTTYSFSFDYNLEKAKSGIGLSALKDQAGSSGYTHTNLSLLYSYGVRLSKKIMLNSGFKFGYNQSKIDFSKLRFSDQIENGGASTAFLNSEDLPFVNIGFGSLLYSNNSWFGFSVDHLNRPNVTLINENDILPIKWSVHGGYKLVIDKSNSYRDDHSVTFALNYKEQGKFRQLQLGGYYSPKQFILGLWYTGIPGAKTYENNPNIDAVSILGGYSLDDITFGYSYDITISKLTNKSGGSHELSIVYLFANKRQKRSRRMFFAPCPKF